MKVPSNENAPLPLQVPVALGTGRAVPISGSAHLYLRRVDRQANGVTGPSRFDRCIVVAAALLACAAIAALLSSCIPVTIRPEFDDSGKPKATPVTLVGSQDLTTGQFLPIYPVSDEAPAPPKDWWPMVESVLMIGLGLLTGTGGGMVLVRRAKTALKIASELADANAEADTEEQVAQNKKIAQAKQEAAGVHALTQSVRLKG